MHIRQHSCPALTNATLRLFFTLRLQENDGTPYPFVKQLIIESVSEIHEVLEERLKHVPFFRKVKMETSRKHGTMISAAPDAPVIVAIWWDALAINSIFSLLSKQFLVCELSKTLP